MPRPEPPLPQLNHTPPRAFGWLDARLLHEGWLARLGPDAVAVLALLAIAADRRGSSFFGRARMSAALSLSRERVDLALARLLELRLVVHRPWRTRHPDGVWQLLPLPSEPPVGDRTRGAVRLSDVVDELRRRLT
ncbi:MAG: hypothetical protein KC766_39960 [Myxococcales bacterium]|nr:hypothetical protein [Myxococcales bacterium]